LDPIFGGRPDGDSPTKKRNNNLIVFNPANSYPLECYLKFDLPVKQNGVKPDDDVEISVTATGHSLRVVIDGVDSGKVFKHIEYTDHDTLKKYRFRLLIVPFAENFLKKYETNFAIHKDDFLLIDEVKNIEFNSDASIELKDNLEHEKEYVFKKDEKLNLTFDYNQDYDDLVTFKISCNDFILPVGIKPEQEPLRPITGLAVWKEKREQQLSFKFLEENDAIKLVFKNQEYTVSGVFRKNLLLEREIIQSDDFSWMQNQQDELATNSIEISQELKNNFNELRNHYRAKDLLPSLAYMDEELIQLAKKYVVSFIACIDGIPEKLTLTSDQKNLAKIGVVKEGNGECKIKFTPLHPLNVAFQICFNEKVKDEQLYEAILERINVVDLVPYLLLEEEKVYVPMENSHSPEWLYYSVYLNSKQSVPKLFVKSLITSKLKEFTENFSFLFNHSSYAPVKINAINLGNCREVIQGIFEYYRAILNKKGKRIQELRPIDVCIYGSDNIVTKFEELAFYHTTQEVEDALDVELKTKNYDEDDLLSVFQEKVRFYSKSIPDGQTSYEYAHITFYQFDRSIIKYSSNEIENVKTGVSLDGLMADVSSVFNIDNYRTGFGTKHISANENDLIKLTKKYNALTRVAHTDDIFESTKALCTTINLRVKEDLNQLYDNSQWVTYIDPKVDLNFFKEKEDLIIIHYSDQYNNSSGYDAITVTRKSKQYEYVVKEFLEKKKVSFQEGDTLKVINFFNAINGDWLLKLISQNGQFPREKISLLSGIKSALSFLEHPDFIWIPVSLEEILRVSGGAGLKQDDGLFSVKNLENYGLPTKERMFSDDLLFIGLQELDGELKMHLYPIEVKIGNRGIVKKGEKQGLNTVDLLYTKLNESDFKSEIHRHFFAKQALINAEKMDLYGIWEGRNWKKVYDSYRQKLLSNDFTISNTHWDCIGKYGLLYFGSDIISRKLELNESRLYAELLETDGYDFLVKPIPELVDLFHNTTTSINKNLLFKNACGKLGKEITEISEEQRKVILPIKKVLNNNPESKNEKEIIPATVSKEPIKILFGHDLNNGLAVNWEPTSTHKVMHTNTGIIGTMGTGKTQFTKSVIAQLYKNAANNVDGKPIGILIFDYKGDYIKDDFVNATNAKIYNLHHLPYNPLSLDATEASKPMLPLHTANNIKETIASAFNLGNVQKQKLRDIIIAAYEAKGIYKAKRETWSAEPPTIGDVCEIYLSKEDASQDSLYAAISDLHEFEIFEPQSEKTKSLYDIVEGVTVINLSGYGEDIQNLIVAITLDLFYTQMQKNGHSKIEGNFRQIKKMILVDEADNFLSKNFTSIRKILKEGREFGVGTILSTQFLNHFSTSENDYSNYILTWIIHRVNEIKPKEIDTLFNLKSKEKRDNLISTIKALEKHKSIVNLAGSDPVLIKDLAFWELKKNRRD